MKISEPFTDRLSDLPKSSENTVRQLSMVPVLQMVPVPVSQDLDLASCPWFSSHNPFVLAPLQLIGKNPLLQDNSQLHKNPLINKSTLLQDKTSASRKPLCFTKTLSVPISPVSISIIAEFGDDAMPHHCFTRDHSFNISLTYTLHLTSHALNESPPQSLSNPMHRNP